MVGRCEELLVVSRIALVELADDDGIFTCVYLDASEVLVGAAPTVRVRLAYLEVRIRAVGARPVVVRDEELADVHVVREVVLGVEEVEAKANDKTCKNPNGIPRQPLTSC